MANSLQRSVAVLGMHRSGTSAVGRLLMELGGVPGRSFELMAAKPDNPHGFFERLDVFALHEELLLQTGATWDTLHDVALEQLAPDELDRAVERWAEIIGKIDGGSGFSFVKDPRLAFFMDLWRRVWQPTVALVIIRHPAAVAASLASRNELAQLQALALWESYVVQSLAVCPDLPRLVVSFERLCAAPDAEAHRIARFLKAHDVLLEDIGAEQTAEAIDESVVHHRVQGDSPLEWPWLEEIWSELRTQAEKDAPWEGGVRRLSATGRQILHSARVQARSIAAMEEQETFYRTVVTVEQQRYNDLFERRTVELEDYRQRVEQLEDSLRRSQEADQAGATPGLEALEGRLAAVEEEHRTAVAGLEQTHQGEVVELRRQLETATARLRETRRAHEELEAELRSEVRAEHEKRESMAARLSETEGELEDQKRAVGELESTKAELEEAGAALNSAIEAERAQRQIGELELEQLTARLREVEWVLERYESSRSVRWSKAVNRALRRL